MLQTPLDVPASKSRTLPQLCHIDYWLLSTLRGSLLSKCKGISKRTHVLHGTDQACNANSNQDDINASWYLALSLTQLAVSLHNSATCLMQSFSDPYPTGCTAPIPLLW